MRLLKFDGSNISPDLTTPALEKINVNTVFKRKGRVFRSI
jgi:hypothetical protein